MKNKAIEKAKNDKMVLAKKYNVPDTCIVWFVDNHYIIVKEGKEIRV